MKKKIKFFKGFSVTDIAIWGASVILIIASQLIFGGESTFALVASLVGSTSLIFNARGNPFGQVLIICFSIMYGIISYTCAYYGEMITYLGMTAPMAVFALISWIRNPSRDDNFKVKINRLSVCETVFAFILTTVVTVVFYFILKYFDTANLIVSTVSVATSFIAAYLTFRRSAFFALAYAANDIVLIILWSMAVSEDISYLSVTVCFVTFLLNDIYGFITWLKMRRVQERDTDDAADVLNDTF